MKLEPLPGRVIVKRCEPEGKSKGGILLPDIGKERPKMGVVVEAHPRDINRNGDPRPMPVQEGDTVIFTTYAGTDFKLDGEEYVIMRPDDILAIVRK